MKLGTEIKKINKDRLYMRNRVAAHRRNKSVIGVALAASFVCFAFLFSVSFFSETYRPMRPVYATVGLLYMLFFALSKILKPGASTVLAYCMHLFFTVFCTYVSAIVWPDNISIMLLAELFMFSTVILDKSVRIILASLFSITVYLVTIYFFKTPAIFTDELINAVCFTLLSGIVGVFSRNAQLRNYDNMEKLRVTQEHYELAMKHNSGIICEFDIVNRCLIMSPDVAIVMMMPERISDMPDGPVRAGVISSESIGAYLDFYGEIIDGGKTGESVFRRNTTDGWRWIKANYSTIFSDDGKPISAVISYSDISKQVAQDNWRQKQADTDGLTAVLNRAATEREISRKMAEYNGSLCAFLIVDLDKLKNINDNLGHPQGDRAIKALSEALVTSFRGNDTVGRIGGDEFVLFAPDLTSMDELVEALDRTMSALSRTTLDENGEYKVSASIGVVFDISDGSDFQSWYDRADKALYKAKRDGRSRYVLYDSDIGIKSKNTESSAHNYGND